MKTNNSEGAAYTDFDLSQVHALIHTFHGSLSNPHRRREIWSHHLHLLPSHVIHHDNIANYPRDDSSDAIILPICDELHQLDRYLLDGCDRGDSFV
jgi:hypothetical protein